MNNYLSQIVAKRGVGFQVITLLTGFVVGWVFSISPLMSILGSFIGDWNLVITAVLPIVGIIMFFLFKKKIPFVAWACFYLFIFNLILFFYFCYLILWGGASLT